MLQAPGEMKNIADLQGIYDIQLETKTHHKSFPLSSGRFVNVYLYIK